MRKITGKQSRNSNRCDLRFGERSKVFLARHLAAISLLNWNRKVWCGGMLTGDAYGGMLQKECLVDYVGAICDTIEHWRTEWLSIEKEYWRATGGERHINNHTNAIHSKVNYQSHSPNFSGCFWCFWALCYRLQCAASQLSTFAWKCLPLLKNWNPPEFERLLKSKVSLCRNGVFHRGAHQTVGCVVFWRVLF